MHGARLNDTGVIDHTGQQAVARACAEQHFPAIGLKQSAVVGQGVDLVAGDLQAQQRAAFKVEADRAARAQRCCAAGGVDAALIGDTVAQERDIAAVCSVDLAEVGDTGCAVCAKALAALVRGSFFGV